MTYTMNPFGKAFAHVQNCLQKEKHMAQTKILMDSTQKRGFSKLCVKIKKKCYTDILFSKKTDMKFIILVSNLKEISSSVFSGKK
jgi:hypothetical protein